MDDDEQLVPLGSALQQMRAGELETISRQVAEDVVARKVRYPPQTATIERAIIGGMLRGGIATVLEATQQGLGSHDISQPAHAVLFGTCVTLAQQGLPVALEHAADVNRGEHLQKSKSAHTTTTNLDFR